MITLLYSLLIASFPLGVLTRFQLFPSVSIYLQDVFILMILIFSAHKIINYLFQKKTSLVYAFAGFFAISLFGILTHTNSFSEFVISILYLLRLYVYILLIVPLLYVSAKDLRRLKLYMMISGFVFVAFGYIQYVFYPNLRNLYYLGWDEHLYRLFSTLLDPNFSGIYMMLILLLFLSFIFEKFKHSSYLTKAFYVFGLVFLFGGILLTYSRSAFIVLVVSFVLFIIMTGYKKIIVLILILFGVGIFLLPQNFGGEGVNLLRVASIFSRAESNMQGFLIFVQNPLFGVGYNTLRFIQVDYGFVGPQNALVSHAASGFPNSYVVLLATTGLLGISLAIFILGNAFKFLLQERNKNVFYTVVFVSFCGVLISSIFENTLLYGPIIIWITLIMGILLGSRRK